MILNDAEALVREEFLALMDAIPVSIFVKDAGSRFLVMNHTCESMLGCTRRDVLGSDGGEYFPAHQRAQFRARDREAIRKRQGIDYEHEVRHPGSGKTLRLHTFKRPVYSPDGTLRYLIGASIDVTDRSSVENELRTSEEKLRGLFELSRLGIALTDMEGHYLEFNEAFQRICGYTRDELNALDYWALTPQEYAIQEREQLQSLEKSGAYGPYEKEYVRKDGSRVPLRLNGVLVHGSDGRPYIWSMVEDITERRQKDEQIWRQANFDSLTELPNRRLFRDRLEQEVKKSHRTGVPLALLFIDLDRFKDINDALGHAKGDLLLIEAARRIRACVRETDTLARLGGDEFTVVLPDLHDAAAVERVAQGILQELLRPFDLGAEQGYVSASIGITLHPNDADDVETLLRHADQAMYQAKALGRNRFAYFTPAMQQRAEQKLMLGNDLHHALERGDLFLHYQPIVDLASGQVAKAEALLRWRHAEHGMIEPLDFVPLAEESGLIQQIGLWVLDEAVRTVHRLRHVLGRMLQISVNKSPLQFIESAGTMDFLAGLLDAGLPPHAIVVEITEGVLINDAPSVQKRLRRFQEAGVEVAIDDFGTGFSSLAYLKKFHVDYLKIDRSFVRDIGDDPGSLAIIGAIVAMAHKLGIRTIAEGVETEAQRIALRDIGCDYGQGFLFSPALPLEELIGRLQRWPAGTGSLT